MIDFLSHSQRKNHDYTWFLSYCSIVINYALPLEQHLTLIWFCQLQNVLILNFNLDSLREERKMGCVAFFYEAAKWCSTKRLPKHDETPLTCFDLLCIFSQSFRGNEEWNNRRCLHVWSSDCVPEKSTVNHPGAEQKTYPFAWMTKKDPRFLI